jgi:hypothetical protein
MKHYSYILNDGFIKLARKLMSQPEISQLIDKEKGLGLGLYFSINLYLANSKGGWGLYTGRQLRALAAEMKTSWKVVKRVIDDYGLFIVEGDRFTSPWMQDQFAHAGKKKGSSRANILMHAEEIEKDIEKKNKEKATVRVSDDTHMASDEDTNITPSPSSDRADTNVNYLEFSHYLKR